MTEKLLNKHFHLVPPCGIDPSLPKMYTALLQDIIYLLAKYETDWIKNERTRNVLMRHGCPDGGCKFRIWDLLKLPNTKIHKCKVHNITENNTNRTISELDLCILMTHYWIFIKVQGA